MDLNKNNKQTNLNNTTEIVTQLKRIADALEIIIKHGINIKK